MTEARESKQKGEPLQPPTPRLLLLGFSCTELGDGYTKTLIPDLVEHIPGVEVMRCGLGGLTPPTIPSFLIHMQETVGPFTHVVFEISTSAYQWLEGANDETTIDVLRDIVSLCGELHISPFFLMLYRKPHKPPVIYLNRLIKSVAAESNVPFLDLAEGFATKFGHDFAQQLLRDVVHTTALGGALQADLALWRLVSWVCEPGGIKRPSVAPRFRRKALRVQDYVDNTWPSGEFTRRDMALPYVDVEAGRRLKVDLGHQRLIMGVSYVMGPQSGYFKMVVDGDEGGALRVPAYDQRSYYSRMSFRPFNAYKGRRVRTLEFEIIEGRQDVVPLKGGRQSGLGSVLLVDIVELNEV